MDIISIIRFIRKQSRLTNLVPKTENFVYPLSFYIPPYEGNWCLNRFTKVTVQEVDQAVQKYACLSTVIILRYCTMHMINEEFWSSCQSSITESH
jgi:hypothetical protein